MVEQASVPRTQYLDTLTDSRLWARFQPRADDIVVITPPKSGTTWVQAILALLISGDPSIDANLSQNSPWFDNKLNNVDETVSRLEAQSGRRHVKTHTPFDGVPIWPEIRYVAVYRHPIDVHFSFRKHVANYRPEFAEMLDINETTFPSNPRDSFRNFIEGDDFDKISLKAVVNHYKTALAQEPAENILRLHYADMRAELPANMQNIAEHIGVSHPPELMEKLVKAATFESMKENADRFALAAGRKFWKKDSEFFDSATSNKWDGVLNDDDLAAYNKTISKLLGRKECRWLEWGSVKG